MLFDLINAARSGDAEELKWAVVGFVLSLPIILLILCVHEVAHGFVANKLGDPTAKSLGRLTLNPLKHLDPFGFLAMLCVGIGWANPVPINTRYFKKPKRDMAICAAAGPLSNILMGLISMILLRLVFLFIDLNPELFVENYNVFYAIILLFETAAQLNIVFAVFNLFPIPPLDGSKILYMFLPNNILYKILPYERYISLGFLALILLDSFLPVSIISTVIWFFADLILGLFELILFF